MKREKLLTLFFLLCGCFYQLIESKDTLYYMEKLFNQKSDAYRNLVEKTESWLRRGEKGSILGCVIGVYGKSQMEKEKTCLDFALKKRYFSGKTIRDGGLVLILVGLSAQAPFWYMNYRLYEEALLLKQEEEQKNKNHLSKK